MIGEGGRELTELMAVARENVALFADAAEPTPTVPLRPVTTGRAKPVISTTV